MPGSSLSVDVSSMNLPDGSVVVVEPRVDAKTFAQYGWPNVRTTAVIAGEMALLNDSDVPIMVYKNDHICQVRTTTDVTPFTTSSPAPSKRQFIARSVPFSSDIVVDDQLTSVQKMMFAQLHADFDDVFQPTIGRYNDYNGKVRARVNIGATKPPPKKLHAPNYCKNNLDELQDKFDELESQGVFVRPEDVGVTVEFVSPSFLVNKTSGNGKRLVTAFTSIGEYCKTLPISMPTVDDVLRTVASWKYLIKTDLRDSFYQVPLDKDSMKWCGTQTPYRGLRCYAVSAQGMPGSSETLEEMMCTILGQMVRDGHAAKIADDLYVGSSVSIEDLLDNWRKALMAIRQCGLKLKSSKTHVAPKETQMLGWDWKGGQISACSHKITPLATCKPPETATAMRSFIGAYKVFNRVLRGCSQFLADMELSISGKQKTEKIVWTESLTDSFRKAQEALKSSSCITTPTPGDQLIITHDGSQVGIGAVMFVKRSDKLLLGGFFSAKLKAHHSRWLPCELEALSIAASIQHFAPFIRESLNTTQILTDSKPCVQSFQKMTRGEFSTSARIATFLSALSEFNVQLHHISGQMNLPSDFHSRNPRDCSSDSCQVCKFINDADQVAVRAVSVDTILSGQYDAPYANRSAWKLLQAECSDLRRVHAHLSKGTKPADKRTNATAIKRYLNDVVIARDGVLVVIRSELYHPRKELIVVPKHLLNGLLTSIHLQLNHASAYQLQKVFSRNYFSQCVAKCVASVVGNCHTCQSLKVIPRELHSQSTTDFPKSPTRSYAADVVRRHGQKLFIMTDTFSTFVTGCIISDETSTTLKNSLIAAISSIRPNPQTNVSVRTDNAPGFKSLSGDSDLQQLRVSIDLGRVLNKNKNPVADKCISELITELLKVCPEGGKITPVILSFAINTLNSRIRNRGLSAWEILFQRDQHTLEPLEISDSILASDQCENRSKSHAVSAKSKSRNAPVATQYIVAPGSLVYLKEDGGKDRLRERYIIVSLEDDFYVIQKLNRSLRNVKYKVKPSEVYPVTPTINDNHVNWELDEDDGEEEEARVIDRQINDDSMMPPAVQRSPGACDIDPVGGTPATSQQTEEPVPDVQAVSPVACHDAPQNLTIVQEVGSPVADENYSVPAAVVIDEVRLVSPESPQDDVPPARSRPRRHTRPPERFKEYVLY